MIEQLQEGARNAVRVISQGREQTEESVEQTNRAGTSLESITAAFSSITDMNLQIAGAASEQSQVAEEVARNVHRISEVSDETASGALQTATASQQLAALASKLQGLVGQFQV